MKKSSIFQEGFVAYDKERTLFVKPEWNDEPTPSFPNLNERNWFHSDWLQATADAPRRMKHENGGKVIYNRRKKVYIDWIEGESARWDDTDTLKWTTVQEVCSPEDEGAFPWAIEDVNGKVWQYSSLTYDFPKGLEELVNNIYYQNKMVDEADFFHLL